jgi:hypothetical protein
MIVAGAGLAGLIAASMLRDEVEVVYELQSSLPNNHSALLRFRSSVVGDAVGIPFRKVKVMKAIDPWRNPVADALSYSMKCTGKAQLRSIVSAAGEIEERFIAPDDFIQRLAKQIEPKIVFDAGVSNVLGRHPVISTIPMPAMMDLLGWEDKPAFDFTNGWTITCDLPKSIDVCATVYCPHPAVEPYRVSVTDHRLIIEISDWVLGEQQEEPSKELAIGAAVMALGIEHLIDYVQIHHEMKRMKYAKIVPIDDGVRKRFIVWASEKHNVYSLGRFATWRPGLLLDDVVNDVRQIQKMAAGEMHAYKLKLKG